MPTTRSSARLINTASSAPARSQDETSPEKTVTRSKRKTESTGNSPAKRGRKVPVKKQKTIEESIPEKENVSKAIEMRETAGESESADKGSTELGAENKPGTDNKEQPTTLGIKETPESEEGSSKYVRGVDEQNPKKPTSEAKDNNSARTQEGNASAKAIEISDEREEKIPSNILEKGIIYFFTRARVGMDNPERVSDLQRSYFVLRPLPKGAKIGDGPLDDLNCNRLFALPKKVWPRSHRDKFMAFVEKGNSSITDLKKDFFQGVDYNTKTRGMQTTPPATSVGEGVYAITETGRSSHLVYMLTIPSEPGKLQEELGLRRKGSFVMSIKNPARGGPRYAQLPQSPEFPEEIIEEFRGLAWASVQPKHLDYANAQVLLIGEGTEEDFGKAMEGTRKDSGAGKKTIVEEMEKLEHEDELRVEHLHGDDSVFDDLGISKEEYPKVPTTW